VSEIADFYHTYYRPERATLVIVGDIDIAAMETEIKNRFSDWQPTGTGRPDPDLGAIAQRGQEALLFSEAGAPQYASVAWVTPYDSAPDTAAKRKRNRIEGVGFAVLNQRLAEVAQQPTRRSRGRCIARKRLAVRQDRLAARELCRRQMAGVRGSGQDPPPGAGAGRHPAGG
jgi:hypothetical protein